MRSPGERRREERNSATMHICFLCNEYPPGPHGGVGSFTRALGRGLASRGHRITALGIYPRDRAGEEDDCGVRVVRLPHTRVPFAGWLAHSRLIERSLASLHREVPIDVVDGPELSLATVPRSFPARKVIRMNGGHHFFSETLGTRRHPWRCWLERSSFGRAEDLCAVSRFVGEATRRLLRLGDRTIEILPNPVDVTHFAPHRGVREEEGLLLFVGTVCEKKGIRQLVQAMPRIVSEVPHARLVVAGRDWTDPLTGESFTASLKHQIPTDLTARVEFLGHVENDLLPGLMGAAQVCVYPSHMEAMPVAWLEGLAMGKAVLASRVGPGPEVIEDGETGLLCDPHDPKSIADGAIRLLTSPVLRRRLGAAARSRAQGDYSVEVLAAKNEAFYERSLAKGRGRS